MWLHATQTPPATPHPSCVLGQATRWQSRMRDLIRLFWRGCVQHWAPMQSSYAQVRCKRSVHTHADSRPHCLGLRYRPSVCHASDLDGCWYCGGKCHRVRMVAMWHMLASYSCDVQPLVCHHFQQTVTGSPAALPLLLEQVGESRQRSGT
jgi:hypothetical protein